MLASFLPLPLDPKLGDARSQTDLEQQFARNFGAVDDKAFQKATWWRNLNRVMSGIGTLLVSSTIFLGVIKVLKVYRLESSSHWPSSCRECRKPTLLLQHHRTTASPYLTSPRSRDLSFFL
jgi:hypothetical protein